MKRFCILYSNSNKITCNSVIGIITSFKNILQLNQSEQFKFRLFDVVNVNTIEHISCKYRCGGDNGRPHLQCD